MTNALFRFTEMMSRCRCPNAGSSDRQSSTGTDYITSFPFQTNNLGGRPSSESLAISVHLVV